MIYYKHLVNRLQLSNDRSIPTELMNTKSSHITMNTSVCVYVLIKGVDVIL